MVGEMRRERVICLVTSNAVTIPSVVCEYTIIVQVELCAASFSTT